jgi:hypothetical protein
MNHRRHKAMRFVKLLWITKEPRRALVFYLINTPLPKSGFLACISSRITTVIQVVRYYQINDNWFNEPFAVSPYRLLILRHAWLNLWDKHMTTGRINQVTILTAVASRRPRYPVCTGQSCTLKGGARTPTIRTWSKATQDLLVIRLPPLSFLKDRPPHRSRAPEHRHRVWYRPLRRRIPSIGPRSKERMPTWAYPQLSCENDTHQAIVHRLQQSPPYRGWRVVRHLYRAVTEVIDPYISVGPLLEYR